MHDFDQEPLWLFLRFIWLNGPGWMAIFQRRREQKNDQKRLLTDTTPKTRALNQDLSIKTRQVCALFRRREGKREVGVLPLAVCLRSLAKNNRRHVQQAVSKKNQRYSVLRMPSVFALTALLPPNRVWIYLLNSVFNWSPSLGMKVRKSLLLVKIR